jgi:DNA-binding transcriptional LysR family regulator
MPTAPHRPATPPLELFRTFAEVARANSFSAAAESLGVSKATVSKAIADLEARLGVQLLRRTTRQLSLTEAGVKVEVRARRMIEEADAAVEDAADAAGATRGRLRVSAPMSWGLRYLSAGLPAFMAANPSLEIDLVLEDRAVDLVAESFDVALRIGAPESSTLTMRRISDVHRVLVAAPGYIKAHGAPEVPEDLPRHSCLHYSNLTTGAVWKLENAAGGTASVRVNGSLCANNGDVLQAAVRAGKGIGLQPDFLLADDIASGAVIRVMTAWHAPLLALHALTPPGRQLPAKSRAFIDWVHGLYGAGRAPWLKGV